MTEIKAKEKNIEKTQEALLIFTYVLSVAVFMRIFTSTDLAKEQYFMMIFPNINLKAHLA